MRLGSGLVPLILAAAADKTEDYAELSIRKSGRVSLERRERMAMDPAKMLEDLLEQRRLIDATIANVERLVAARKPRGRPSKAVVEARSIVGKPAKRGRKRGKRRESAAGGPVSAS
jgi:hypothetical protein